MTIRQSGAISGGSRKRNQIAELNARQSMLPQIIANQRYAEGIGREDELNQIQQNQFSRQHALNEENFSFQKKASRQARDAADRASEVGLGLEAGKLGLTVGQRYGGKTFGGVAGDAKSLFTSGVSSPSTFGGGGKFGNFVSNMSVGSAVGGGLAGFGVSKLMGKKKSKLAKGLAGAATGATMGLLGGSNAFGGAFSGGLGGLIGGLFG
jgi:hypothetical protein